MTRTLLLIFLLLGSCISTFAQTWQPTVDMHTTGYSDSWNRTVVRTKANVVYYVMNGSAISSGLSKVRVFKGNAAIPTSFLEMDAAHEPGDSTRIIGVDARLNDTTGVISIAYQLTSPLEARYITFNTNTDMFGAVETIATVNHAPALRYLSKVSLALDANGVPHVTFGGDNEGLFYSNRIGGTWSQKFSISGNPDDMHPSLTFGTDGVLHLAWLNFDSPRSILYRERATSGTWTATETVDGAVGTVGDKVDQSPSIALTIDNKPLILYHDQSAQGNPNVKIKRRDSATSYVDVAPTPAGTAAGHDWAITVDSAGNWTICGHGNTGTIEPQCMTRANSTNTWGAPKTLINDGIAHDGSASLRYDLIFPGDQTHLDLAYFDENSPPDSFYMTATLSGGGGGGGTPSASLSPASLAFADQILNTTSAKKTVTVKNVGTGNLTISAISAQPPFVQTSNCIGASLVQNQSCDINVTFSPTTMNSFTGNLLITDNDAATSPQKVPLSGVGTDFSFPAPSGTESTGTLTSSSSASYSLTVTGVSNFAGTITFACGGLPQNTQCQFSPASPSFQPNNESQTVSLTVSRISNVALVTNTEITYGAAFGFGLVLLIFAARRPVRKVRFALAAFCLLFAASITVTLSGCGGGNSSVQPPPVLQPTAGTYHFTVTAAALGQTKPPITLTLIVQ